MDSGNYAVRRANLDDLGGLKLLWERTHLQVLDLEKHLTQFQLIATPDGELLGAVALGVHAKDGRLHSEAFTRPELAAELRPYLWERIATLSRNLGLTRIWTEENAPDWAAYGFRDPPPELRGKLPAGFGSPGVRWRLNSLREEVPSAGLTEKEFELYQQTEKARTEQVLNRALRVRTLIYLVLLALAVAALIWSLRLVQSSGGFPSPQRKQSTDQPG